jgi:hypothetical protein
MKQQIQDALKTRFEGIDEKILNRIAEKTAKTVTTEDGVQPAVDGVTFQQIIDGESDRRATEATQKAVTNYEKKHGLKDGQKIETGGGAKEDGRNSGRRGRNRRKRLRNKGRRQQGRNSGMGKGYYRNQQSVER